MTLATYSLATLGTGLSVNAAMFFVCRFFTGVGIGGEYAAINSAVDELIPGKVRGTVDLIVNATFWMGATLGSLAALFLMGGHFIPVQWGWRLPSPSAAPWASWCYSCDWPCRKARAGSCCAAGSRKPNASSGASRRKSPSMSAIDPVREKKLKIRSRDHTPLGDIFKNMLGENRKRSVLGLTLMVGQAFFFNAIFFTFGLIAKQFYHVSDAKLPLQLMPFAIASLLGPILLGPLFDKVGRKPMITATYGIAGLLLVATAILFATDTIALKGLIVCFSVIFFTASSAASAAYLTVSEIFPLEIRAFAIAIFYALGTSIGGVGAPALFGMLIASGSKTQLMMGYLLGAALMLAGAVAEFFIGVEAAGKSLESVSKPLQSAD